MFDQLHLQVHTSVSAPNAITKMPPHRVLYVDTSPEYYIVFQGDVASEGRRLGICQSVWESDGGTLKPLTCHSSVSTNMPSMGRVLGRRTSAQTDSTPSVCKS